jgi:cytochrome P450
MMKEQAQQLVARWAELSDDEPLDARAWMERYTLEVSGRGACRYDFGLLNESACPHAFAQAVPESTKESIARVAEPRPDLALSPSRRNKLKRYRKQNDELFSTADALVRARMHTQPLGQQTDLLSRLVSTPDPETGELLDAETIRDQILMHLSNGFNGPSITGAWLAYVLATRPDVEEKLIAEIDSISGGDPDYDLKYDDLMSLTYTTQVIKETMRIYPPMPVTIRRSLKDGSLGRYRVRRGDIILVGTLAAQRYDAPEPVNLGAAHEISIRELAELIADVVGYEGRIVWDIEKPNGQPRRSVDATRARELFGFEAKTSLREGIERTVAWYRSAVAGVGRT